MKWLIGFLRRRPRPTSCSGLRLGTLIGTSLPRLGHLDFWVCKRRQNGGGGEQRFSFNAVVSEAAIAAGFSNIGLRLHADIVLPYFVSLADAEQSKRWLPELIAGRSIAAIAMSEPGTGSDLANIRTTADPVDGGYVLNGSKCFITNGWNADLIIVIARTTDNDSDRRHGLTALVVERDADGFTRSQPYDKIGLPYSDTTDLFFDDVWVPSENRLGAENRAFDYLATNLPQERISISVGAVAMARAAVTAATTYAKERIVFEKPLSSFQNTRFVLADADSTTEACEHMLDRALICLDAGELQRGRCGTSKALLHREAIANCRQLFAGVRWLRLPKGVSNRTNVRGCSCYANLWRIK